MIFPAGKRNEPRYVGDKIVEEADLRGCSIWDSFVCGLVLRSGTNDNPRCHLHHIAAYHTISEIPRMWKSAQ